MKKLLDDFNDDYSGAILLIFFTIVFIYGIMQ